jgi:hypothetical protein
MPRPVRPARQVERDHPALPADLARRDLRPAARRGTEVDHPGAGPQQAFARVDLQQLARGARAVALRGGFAHVRIRDVPVQPALARRGFRHRPSGRAAPATGYS